MAYTIDKTDLKILGKLKTEGPSFLASAAWERRAADMRRHGYVNGEMKMYSMTGGGQSATFRTEYTITDKGREALAPVQPAQTGGKE